MSVVVATPLGLNGRDFKLLILGTLGAFSNFAPLMTVVPMWAATAGATPDGMGAVTVTMMGATVAFQLLMPALLRRFALHQLFAVGGLLMGVPTFGLLLSAELPWVLAISLVRGAGFGLAAVSGSALAAALVPANQRGKAVGAYGVAIGLPQLLMLPLGVWVAQEWGYAPVFLVTGALAVLAAPAMWAMSGQRVTEPATDSEGVADTLRRRVRALAGPWAVMLGVACAFGGLLTFLPLAVGDDAVAPVALFAMSAGVVSGRWMSGVITDRMGEGRLLLPAAGLASLGMLGLAWSSHAGFSLIVAAIAVVYGLGFGALQNDSLVVMFRRAGPGNGGFASVTWNIAYDAGMGLGGLVVGGITAAVGGVAGAFLAVGCVIAVLTPLAWRDGRLERRIRRDPVPCADTGS